MQKSEDVCYLAMPSEKYKKEAEDYINEFVLKGDDPDGFPVNESSAGTSVDRWFEWINGNEGQPVEEGSNQEGEQSKGFNLTFFYVSEATGRIIGTVNVRQGDGWEEKYGNIGFAVRPSEREKGLGTDMLNAAKSLCAFFGMESLTAVCGCDNEAAKALLLRCGFEKEPQKDCRTLSFKCDIERVNADG